MVNNNKLSQLREQIDAIDSRILALISERAECAQKVAEVKQAEGDTVYFRPEREAQVLRNIMEKNQGPLGNEEMARLFREIMSACLALEQPIKVALLVLNRSFLQGPPCKRKLLLRGGP